MKMIHGFDPERNVFIINFQVSFLDKYLPNLRGMMKGESLPKNIEVKRINKNEVEISFPAFKDTKVKEIPGMNGGEIAIPSEFKGQLEKFYDTLNVFINVGIRKEMSKYEIIPLQGYDVNDLFTDIQTAWENKRGYLIIKDYEEFLVSQKNKTYEFTQYVIDHGSLEWADFTSETLGEAPENDSKKKKIL